MSLRSSPKLGGREITGDRQLDEIQQAREQLGRRVGAIPFNSGVFIAGEADATLPGGLTDGVIFTTGQTKDVLHGLGRPAIGFVVCDVQTNAAALKRVTTGLTPGLENSHIRLTHTGATTTSVKLVVFAS